MKHEVPPPHWLFRIIMWVTSTWDWIRDLITPVNVRVMEKGLAFMPSAVIVTLCRLDVPEALSPGWNSTGRLAVETGLNEEQLKRLLRAAHQYGFFDVNGSINQFEVRHNRLSKGLLPGNLKDLMVHFHRDLFPLWSRLHEGARTGSDPKAPSMWGAHFGAECWEYLDANPETASAFSKAMRDVDTQGMGAMLVEYPWSKHPRILDIAGATGSLLSEILNVTKAEGIVCDLPKIVGDAKNVWAERLAKNDPLAKNVLPRMSFEPIDFFKKETLPRGKDKDAYILRNVYHDWPDADCLKILTNVRAAIGNAKAKMIMVEMSMLDLKRTPVQLTKSMIDLNMLVTCKGMERNEVQWKQLLAKTGFRLVSVKEARAPFVIWVAEPIP